MVLTFVSGAHLVAPKVAGAAIPYLEEYLIRLRTAPAWMAMLSCAALSWILIRKTEAGGVGCPGVDGDAPSHIVPPIADGILQTQFNTGVSSSKFTGTVLRER